MILCICSCCLFSLPTRVLILSAISNLVPKSKYFWYCFMRNWPAFGLSGNATDSKLPFQFSIVNGISCFDSHLNDSNVMFPVWPSTMILSWVILCGRNSSFSFFNLFVMMSFHLSTLIDVPNPETNNGFNGMWVIFCVLSFANLLSWYDVREELIQNKIIILNL